MTIISKVKVPVARDLQCISKHVKNTHILWNYDNIIISYIKKISLLIYAM